ncbi:MAG: type I-U CRISPR-associated helicase/endonuclease Cas3 [Bryobacterales bacterium]|nr:type I-U CRISPR-associated helicase/endonuclease Cas3 [Bryobacterales bacterium]MBV9396415.1 type I-U CRISPR-associated helicase/endonuclease Cas3 [Bryobacterales bacterium]
MRLDPSRFEDWFRALNDNKKPFPWQQRLFREWLCPEQADSARWPELIKLPTASGKTALIDIAVLALAAGSPAARRRIVFIVDRRVVVDEAALRANAIRERLRAALDSATNPLHEVSRSLLLQGGEEPLLVATLRGGIPDEDEWARSPAQPAVVLSTVDQTGSRLLFRAYGGHGPRSWPIHAGLLGRDALLIVDEAHCAAPFCETAQAIKDRWQDFAEQSIGPSLSLTRMSATPGEVADFELDDDDRKDEILNRRLTASKPAEMLLVESKGKSDRRALMEAILERTQAVLKQMTGGVIGVVVNRVSDARGIFNELRMPEDRKLLLTGRVRGWVRDRLLESWLPFIRAGLRDEADGARVVVATQCIEVGANLDFDYLVTEVAPLDALRQRFGRVDRLGDRAKRQHLLGDRLPGLIVSASRQIEIDETGAKFPDRVYGQALSGTWNWLSQHADGHPARVDFGVNALESILPEGGELQHLCQETARAYPLLPSHLDILAQTNPPPDPGPEVSAFLHGTVRSSPEVTVVWRADLEEGKPNAWPDRVAVQPPVTGEGCPIPIWEFRRWLAGERLADDCGDVEAAAGEEQGNGPAGRLVLRWRGLNDSKVLSAAKISPGDTVVLPAGYGGCDQYGWNPADQGFVKDIGDAVAYFAGRRKVLRIEALKQFAPFLSDPEPVNRAANDLVAWAGGEEGAPEATDVLRRLASIPAVPDWLSGLALALSTDRGSRLVETAGAYAIAGRRGRGEDLGTAGDGSSLGVPVKLRNHCVRVRGYAKRFAKSLALPKTLVSDIALAGVLHDVGKADPRFQVWLHNGDEVAAALADAPFAKSSQSPRNRAAIRLARERSGYPRDGRHEVQSLALIQNRDDVRQRANDWDLVLHLIVSHHGFGRPFVPVVDDPRPTAVTLEHGPLKLDHTSDHRLYRLDSGVSERYWRLSRRYGWWGLAWLETILRLADHRRSEDEERLAVSGG